MYDSLGLIYGIDFYNHPVFSRNECLNKNSWKLWGAWCDYIKKKKKKKKNYQSGRHLSKTECCIWSNHFEWIGNLDHIFQRLKEVSFMMLLTIISRYSAEWTPCIFYLFFPWRSDFGTQHFDNDKDLQNAVIGRLHFQAVKF